MFPMPSNGSGATTMPGAMPGGPEAMAASAPMPAMPGLMPPGSPVGTPPNYATVTQGDGSILLHVKNPDGSLGPVVKLLNPVKPPGGASAPK